VQSRGIDSAGIHAPSMSGVTDRMASQAALLARADLLEAKRRACHAAFARRGAKGSPTWAAWEESAAALREAFAQMYPPSLYAAITRLRSGELTAVDESITFLEADPWCFRSGYVKADLISALAGLPLDDEARARLRDVVVRIADDDRSRREMKWYRRLATSIMDEPLRAALAERTRHSDPAAAQRARYLLGESP
jgi:hypothetical protein